MVGKLDRDEDDIIKFEMRGLRLGKFELDEVGIFAEEEDKGGFEFELDKEG